MPPSGSNFESLLHELQSLEKKLADNQPHSAFASTVFPLKKEHSFYEFAALLPTEKPLEIEPSWRIGGSQTTASHADLPSEIQKLLGQAMKCCKAPAAPIVAILGLLNAGKSSLVSTFLSRENRRRILVGSANSQGTHRFVLWLPESWRGDEMLWNSIEERLHTVFGCQSEPLSPDAEQAMAQYNDTTPRSYVDASGVQRFRPTIQIPLVATDPQLDRWGLALMDCPDVQTGYLPDRTLPDHYPEYPNTVSNDPLFHEKSQSIADARLAVLANAAPVCSAFVVVLPANAMHDQTVSSLLRVLADRMPNVKQFLAVNRVPRRYEATEIRSELNKLYGQHTVSKHYMAYGFDGPLQRDRLPTPPDGLQTDKENPLPLFFRIDTERIAQPPGHIPNEDWLLNIGSQLDKRSLFEDALASTTSKLRSHIKEGISQSHTFVRTALAATDSLQASIANACLDFSTDQRGTNASKIQLQVSRQIIHQVSQSLERTAPWWAMPGRWTARLAETSKASLVSATHWLQIPQWFSGRTEAIGRWIRSNLTSGQSGKIVTADALMKLIQQHDRRGVLGLDEDSTDSTQKQQVRNACQRAIERFQKESLIQLDDAQLDQFTAKMWADMPMSKRLLTGFAPAGILFAPLIAVVMVPLDFGGSAVLIFASMKELLLAGATGVGLMLANPDSMPKIAESEAAWQQLGDLYAVLCDELGLKRPSASQMPSVGIAPLSRQMPSSRIPEPNIATRNSSDSTPATCVPILYQLNPQSVAGIEESLRRV